MFKTEDFELFVKVLPAAGVNPQEAECAYIEENIGHYITLNFSLGEGFITKKPAAIRASREPEALMGDIYDYVNHDWAKAIHSIKWEGIRYKRGGVIDSTRRFNLAFSFNGQDFFVFDDSQAQLVTYRWLPAGDSSRGLLAA